MRVIGKPHSVQRCLLLALLVLCNWGRAARLNKGMGVKQNGTRLLGPSLKTCELVADFALLPDLFQQIPSFWQW